MPNYQQSPRKQSQAKIWAKRTVHLKTYLQDLPRRLRLDVEALVKIFLTRRSLLLRQAYFSPFLSLLAFSVILDAVGSTV